MVDDEDEDSLSYSSPDEMLDIDEVPESSSEEEGVMVDLERLEEELPSYKEAVEGDVLIHDVVAVIVEEDGGLFDDEGVGLCDDEGVGIFDDGGVGIFDDGDDEEGDTLVRGASLLEFAEEQEEVLEEKVRRVSFGSKCVVINPDTEEDVEEEAVVAPVIDTTSMVFGDHKKVMVDEAVIIKSQAEAFVRLKSLDDVFVSEDELVDADVVVPEGEASESVSSNEATLIEGTALYDGINPFEQALVAKNTSQPVEGLDVAEVAEVAVVTFPGATAFREITVSEESALAAIEDSIFGEITPVTRKSCSDDRTNSFIIPDVISVVEETTTDAESAVIAEPLKGVAATIAGFGQTMVVHTRKHVISPEDSSLEESTIENVSVSDSVDDTEVEKSVELDDTEVKEYVNDFKVEEFVDDTDVEESVDYVKVEEPVDDTKVEESVDETKVKESVNNVRVGNSVDGTEVGESVNNVRVDKSVDDTEVEESDDKVEGTEDVTSTDEALIEDVTSTEDAVKEVKEINEVDEPPPLPPKRSNSIPTICVEEPAPIDQDELEVIETPIEEDYETFEQLVLETDFLDVDDADSGDSRTPTELSYISITPDMIFGEPLAEPVDLGTPKDSLVETESIDPDMTGEGALAEEEPLTTQDVTSGSIIKVLDNTTGTTRTVIDLLEDKDDDPLSDTPYTSDYSYAPLATSDIFTDTDPFTDTEPESIASEPGKKLNLFNIFFDKDVDSFVDSEAEDLTRIRKETVGVQTDDSCLRPNDYSPLYYRNSMMFSTDDELSDFAERGSSKRKRHSIPLAGGLTQVRCEKPLQQQEIQTVPKPRLPGVKSDSVEFDKFELQAKYLACLEPGSVLVSHNVRSLSTTDDEIINTMEEREILEMFNNPYDETNCLSWDWKSVFSDTSSSSSTVVSSKEPAVLYVKDSNEEELVRLGDPLVPIIEQPSEYSTFPNDEVIEDEDLEDEYENMGELTRRVDEFVSTMKIDLELKICPMCPMKCVIL